MSILMPVPHYLNYCSFVERFEIGGVSLPHSFFIFKIVSDILSPLYFFMNFRIILAISEKKKAARRFTRIVLNL